MDPQEVTPKTEIQAFLDSEVKDFNIGYTLFVKFSNNRSLALYLARKQDLSKLIYELQKMVTYNLVPSNYKKTSSILRVLVQDEHNKDSKEAPSENTGEKLKIIVDGKVNYKDLPDELKKVYDETVENYRLQRTAHEQMKLAETDDDRKELRLLVTEYEDKIVAGWKILDDWASGKEPILPVNTIEPNQPLDLVKDINSSRSYLSRNVSSLGKKERKPKEKMIGELKKRVEILVQNKATVKQETFDELIKQGIIDEKTNLLVK